MAVTAYGVMGSITFPLLFEVDKPRERLKAGETYRTKPEIAARMMSYVYLWCMSQGEKRAYPAG